MTDSRKLRGVQQIDVLKQLSQQAAAWLVGGTSRHLRDSDAPRAADGSYNGAELLAWRSRQGSRAKGVLVSRAMLAHLIETYTRYGSPILAAEVQKLLR